MARGWLGVWLWVLASGCSLFVGNSDPQDETPRVRVVTVPPLEGDPFPLLVRLDDSRIDYRLVDDPETDLDFRDDTGASLPFDIDKWEPGGDSAVWVGVTGRESEQELEMVYGSSVRTSPPESAEVWSEYLLVWHLSDSNVAADAASNNPLGARLGAISDAPGVVGSAVAFEGGSFVLDGADANNAAVTSNVTVEAWATFDEAPLQFATLVSKSESGQKEGEAYTLGRGGGTELEFSVSDGLQVGYATSSFDGIGQSPEDWHYFVGIYDSAPQRLEVWVDNEPVMGAPYSGQIMDGSFPFVVGCGRGCDSDNSHIGRIDEVRVSAVSRSSVYVSTAFLNLTESDFLELGPENPVP